MTMKDQTASPEWDHVSQVYLGLLDIGPAGDWLRRRIDWMAEEARGPRVLDVGCGEGILCVLLARRGFSVTGVDIDQDALDFARDHLAKEPDEVRELAEFVRGDILKTAPVTGPFDTVVMGELLDSLGEPDAALDRGMEYLRPGGRVVITTPFGVHPLDNQRLGYRLTDFIGLLKPRIGLDSISVVDNHIRFVGRFSGGGDDGSWENLDAETVLSITDDALVTSQRELYGLLAGRESRIERLRHRLHQRVEGENATQRKVNVSNRKNKRLEFRAKLDRIEVTGLQKQLSERTQEVRTATRELRLLNQRLHGTLSSTSYRLGSLLVRTARRPLTSWKLPWQLLGLYRSRYTPPSKAPAIPEVEFAEDLHAPENDYPDPSQFIDFPLLPSPKASRGGPTVAAIMDTFTEYAFRYEVNLVLLSPIHWRAQMERWRPSCLFVESAWWGNNGGWRDQIVGYENAVDNLLGELLAYCRSNGIPTIFWNKEDPPHFDNFIGAAKEFDYVFTSDADCVPRYKEALEHDRIFVLPFAAASKIHNPSREKGWPNYPVCFAGSWVSSRYPRRAEALQNLLDPAISKGLHIFDRNLTRPEYGQDYRFLERYKEAIKGALSYEEMLTAYRCYDVMLNVNTITESPTMFARRVFESLASATPVISSESAGMSRMLGEHVRVARSKEETAGHLQELLGDEEARNREGHLAYRYVHENHTYRHRINEVFGRVGLEPLSMERPPVSVLMPTMRPQNVARCIENFTRQTYQNKELILILNNAEFDVEAVRRDVDDIPNVQVLHVEGRTTLGDSLNRGVETASGEYVAKMDDDDLYGERYLSDSVLAASFSGAEIVGKGTYFVHFEATNTTALRVNAPEHTFTSATVAGSTMLIETEVARDTPFGSTSVGEDTKLQRSAVRAGCQVYSADVFNYVCARMAQSSRHSWQISDAEFRTNCRDYTPGLDLSRTMI